MPSPSLRMGTLEWVLLIILSILWGGSFFFTGVALRELPPFTIVAVRIVLGCLILHLLLRARGLSLPMDRDALMLYACLGLLANALPFCLLVWGQKYTSSALASILNATTPLFTALVAHVTIRDEPLTARKLAGVVIGLAGVAAMIGVDALRDLGRDLLPQLACLGATLSYAIGARFGRRVGALGLNPLAAATGQLTAASLLILPVALLADRPWTLDLPGAGTIAALGGLAAFSTALAYIVYFRIMATAGATNTLLVALLIPVSAILLGIAFLGEGLAANQVAGMLVIAAGLLVFDGRLFAGQRLVGAAKVE